MDDSTAIVPGVRKIAVLRANAFGDFLFSLPALDALDRCRWIPYIRYHPEVLRMLEVVSLAGAKVMNDIEPHITRDCGGSSRVLSHSA